MGMPAILCLILGFIIGWAVPDLAEESKPIGNQTPIFNTTIKLPIEAPLTDSTLMPLGSGRSNIAISNDGSFRLHG